MPLRRRVVIALVVLAGLIGSFALGLRLAAQRLHAVVLEALGPQAHIGRIELGWSAVELHDLTIAARPGSGWPEPNEGAARRVRIEPDLRSLLPGQPWRLHAVEVEGAQLTMWRRRDGSLSVLPSLLARPPGASAPGTAPASAVAQVVVGAVRLREGRLDYFDATLGAPPHRLVLSQLRAEVGPLVLPQPAGPVPLQLEARLDGPSRQGTVQLGGRIDTPPRNGQLTLKLRGVDLLALQPYLLKRGDSSLRGGALDLDLDATLVAGQLKAPGKVTLSQLRWRDDGGSIAGVPRALLTKVLEREGRIELKFTLAGRMDDPAFSVNENLSARFAAGLAETLGVSVQGVVQGVGGVLKGLLGR